VTDEDALGGEGLQKMESVIAGGPGLVAVGVADGPDDDVVDTAVWVKATED